MSCGIKLCVISMKEHKFMFVHFFYSWIFGVVNAYKRIKS